MNVIEIDEILCSRDLSYYKYKMSHGYEDVSIVVLGAVEIKHFGFIELPFVVDEVRHSFDVSHNNLTSFKNFPRVINGRMNVSNNNIGSLCGIHKIISSVESIDLFNNPIKEGGIGALLIKDIQDISYHGPNEGHRNCRRAFDIIKKYIIRGRDCLLECQEELIDCGLDEFAKL